MRVKRGGLSRPSTDVTPVEREAYFRLLYDLHERAVRGYALRRVDVPADAADVVSETFVVAWRRLAEIPAGAERGWLIGVARRVLSTTRRGHGRRHRLADRMRDELSRLPAWAPSAADSRDETVAAVLAALPRADREVLTLVGWDGLTPAELAQVLGVGDATARTRLHRARNRFRKEWERRTANARGPSGHLPGDGQPLVAGSTRESNGGAP